MKVRTFCFFAILWCFSCSPGPKKVSGPSHLEYRIDSLVLGTAEEDGLDFFVEDIYIEDSSTLGRAIQKQIQEHLVQNNVNFDDEFQTYQSLFIGLKNERGSLENDGFADLSPWELNQGVKVYLNENGLFGLQSYHSSYTGGAHPNTYSSCLLFRLSDGAELQIDSLLMPGEKEAFTSLAEAKFRLQNQMGEKENLNDAGYWFEGNNFHLSNHIRYQKEGLSIYYNPYEIGPYSMGPIEIFIPYNEVVEIIRPEYRFNTGDNISA